MSRKSHPLRHEFHSKPYPFEVFFPQQGAGQPVIFQTPILGQFSLFEDLFWEKRWARFFAEQGFVSVLIHRPIFAFDSGRGLEQIQEYLLNSLSRNQAVLEHCLKAGFGDPSRAASYGISFGSIVNCLWAAQEKRLGVNAYVLAGGNLPEIFMSSRDTLMMSYRRDALACCNNDPQQLKSSLQRLFIKDPLNEVRPSPDKTLLVLARFDRVVPFRYGMALREKMGNPETVYLPFGHYLSMFASPGLKWKVIRFFKEKLGS
jgi:hypothetical protein